MGKNTFRVEFDDGATKSVSINIVDPITNLALYGSGFLEPNSSGGGHDTGDGFKRIAEARHKINEKKTPKDINKILFCPTDYDFFKIINNTKNIGRLDIYCHGWLDGINLGGFKGKRKLGGIEVDGDKIDWMDKNENKGKDLRRVETRENLYLNSTEKTELTKLKSSPFSANTEVYFWGCNIGGQLSPKGIHIANNNPLIKDPKISFAQKFAKKMGKGNVYALVGKGSAAGSMFKRNSKEKNIYSDGEMIPANISYNHGNKNTIILDATKYLKKFPL